MNFFHTFRDEIIKALEELVKRACCPKLDFEKITTEPPRDPSHGDLSTNAAMVLAKPANKNPRELAQLIGEDLKSIPYVEDVSVAGPGFINLSFLLNFGIKSC